MHIQKAMQQIVDDRENQKLQICTILILILGPNGPKSYIHTVTHTVSTVSTNFSLCLQFFLFFSSILNPILFVI